MRRISMLGVGVLLVAGLVVLGGGCQLATSHEGPGPEPGAKTVVVSVTHAQLLRDRDAFYEGVERVKASLDAQDGYVGSSLRRTPLGEEAWTMTAWRDEAALKAFMYADPHAKAMREGDMALKAFRFARFEIAAERWPLSWEEALVELEKVPLQQADDPETTSRAR